MFIITSLQFLGVRSPWKPFQIVMPVPEQKIETVETLRPKLEKKPAKFTLKQPAILVPQTYAAEDIDNAAAYAVIDLDTGEILKEKNGDERLPVASITKVMTAVVALDLAEPAEVFTVDEQAASMIPTKINIVPGERMSLDELLHASLLTSANDATEQIKNGIDTKYHDKVFIDAMNVKAGFLKLHNTHFQNAEGFDNPDNYSSAHDLAVLAHYAMTNYPLIADIVKKDVTVLESNANHSRFNLYNWNGLIGVYPGVHGIKIGNTGDAGKTTMVYSNRGGKQLVAIVLGAPGIIERDMWAAQLLDLGYEQTLGLPPVNVSEEHLLAKYGTWQYTN